MANKIVFKHQQAGLESLSIAGNFTEWEIKPMILNEVDHQWEFEVNNTMLAHCDKQNGKAATYFKFIDAGGVWFTDDNFAKEVDEHGNENNAMYLDVGGDLKDDSLPSGDERNCAEVAESAPTTPEPTPKLNNNTKFSPRREESPVVINESDLEENYHETVDQDQRAVERSRNGSADNSVSTTRDPTEYRNFLQGIIFFFKSLFCRWFGTANKRQGNA